MTPRTTRTYTYFIRWPKWVSRTGYDRPVNWALFRWPDPIPLAVGMFAAALIGGDPPTWIATVLAAWYFVVFPVVFYRRLRARARFCAHHGHTPYRPVPERNEWRCVYCDTVLEVSDPHVVATSVAAAAADVNLARRRSQAYYSDRR